jgi:RNA polymerase sigma factor for flagellar operon FliA
VRDRIRAAIAALPPERAVISLYYFGEVTMKAIGSEIGVNESRVSQLHARAIQRLRRLLCADAPASDARQSGAAVLAFEQMLHRMKLAKATLAASSRASAEPAAELPAPAKGVVLHYHKHVRSVASLTRPHHPVSSLKKAQVRRLAAAR